MITIIARNEWGDEVARQDCQTEEQANRLMVARNRPLRGCQKYARWAIETIEADMANLPVRRVSIECIDHPEWGTWGVYEDRGDYYEIHGNSGGRVLDKAEAVKFWRVVSL